MDEATREALLDKRIMRRLATDSAYRNAENAEDQAERENEIEREEDAKLPPAKAPTSEPSVLAVPAKLWPTPFRDRDYS